ncbi:unnamed protein product, partial [Meganyctiphanes norvegica]
MNLGLTDKSCIRSFLISRYARLDDESYNLLLALWAHYDYLAGHIGQLKVFWRPEAIHRYLAGPLGQFNIIRRPEATIFSFGILDLKGCICPKRMKGVKYSDYCNLS